MSDNDNSDSLIQNKSPSHIAFTQRNMNNDSLSQNRGRKRTYDEMEQSQSSQLMLTRHKKPKMIKSDWPIWMKKGIEVTVEMEDELLCGKIRKVATQFVLVKIFDEDAPSKYQQKQFKIYLKDKDKIEQIFDVNDRIHDIDEIMQSQQNEDEEFVIKFRPKKRQKINAKHAKSIYDKKPKTKSPSTTSEYKPKKNKKRKKKKAKSKKKKRKKNKKENNEYSNIKNKKKTQKKKGNKTTKSRICAHLNEDKIDIFIDGYLREQYKTNTYKTIPIDVIRMINLYTSNIAYIIINFVWNHKYRCECGAISRCDVLKRNRGCYIFKRESNNLYDSNAIAIYGDNGTKHVGYIDRDNAMILAPLMDSNVIRLNCIGGIVGKPCAECVEIMHFNKNATLPFSLQNILESKHYESFKRVTCG